MMMMVQLQLRGWQHVNNKYYFMFHNNLDTAVKHDNVDLQNMVDAFHGHLQYMHLSPSIAFALQSLSQLMVQTLRLEIETEF